MELQERKEKLLQDAAYYRSLTFTLVKMTNYYGQKYSDALEKAQKGEPCAYCLLGQMFEESVHHASKHRDYEYPPLGYRELTKIYYELAALSGYARGAYYLGKSYMSDNDYMQAEKWMLHAAEHHITDSYYALGEIYHALWKQEEEEIYLEKAQTWKQKALEENDTAFVWRDMADFYKDILISGQINDSKQKQSLLSEMTAYYQKAAGEQDFWGKCRACEELVAIFLGDYGTTPDIEKAFLYGEAAMKERSSYAAFRLGEYCMEHQPEEYEKILYYLERAYDFGGKGGGKAKDLLQKYLEETKLPEYMRIEATLLLENSSFENIGDWYRIPFFEGFGKRRNFSSCSGMGGSRGRTEGCQNRKWV